MRDTLASIRGKWDCSAVPSNESVGELSTRWSNVITVAFSKQAGDGGRERVGRMGLAHREGIAKPPTDLTERLPTVNSGYQSKQTRWFTTIPRQMGKGLLGHIACIQTATPPNSQLPDCQCVCVCVCLVTDGSTHMLYDPGSEIIPHQQIGGEICKTRQAPTGNSRFPGIHQCIYGRLHTSRPYYKLAVWTYSVHVQIVWWIIHGRPIASPTTNVSLHSIATFYLPVLHILQTMSQSWYSTQCYFWQYMALLYVRDSSKTIENRSNSTPAPLPRKLCVNDTCRVSSPRDDSFTRPINTGTETYWALVMRLRFAQG